MTPGSIQQHLRTFLVVRTEGGCHWSPAAGGWVAVNHPVVRRAATDRAMQPEMSAVLRPRSCLIAWCSRVQSYRFVGMSDWKQADTAYVSFV